MSIKVKMVSAIAVAASLMSSPIVAKNRYMGSVEVSEQHTEMPPKGQISRRWQHSNGCEYSRAGRPGERVWYLVVNTLGDRDCVRFIVETPHPDMTVTDYYGTPKPKSFAQRFGKGAKMGFFPEQQDLLVRIENAWH